MSNAFSGIVLPTRKVIWKAGIDNHSKLIELAKLDDTKDNGKFAKFEITPDKGYLYPEASWTFKVDEQTVPEWMKMSHEKACWAAYKKWKEQVYSLINIEEAQNPIHPFKIKPPRKITKKHIEMVKQWASLRDSVRAGVGDSVRASVGASFWAGVGDSVRASVGASFWAGVGASVRASVVDSFWAYHGSLYRLPRKAWKYTEKINCGDAYPFQPAIDLWKQGLVASFDGTKWRLHGGEKAKVLWEGTFEKEADRGR